MRYPEPFVRQQFRDEAARASIGERATGPGRLADIARNDNLSPGVRNDALARAERDRGVSSAEAASLRREIGAEEARDV